MFSNFKEKKKKISNLEFYTQPNRHSSVRGEKRHFQKYKASKRLTSFLEFHTRTKRKPKIQEARDGNQWRGGRKAQDARARTEPVPRQRKEQGDRGGQRDPLSNPMPDTSKCPL